MVFSELSYEYDPILSSSCFVPESTFAIGFGIFLTVGIWLSWLPQQIEFAWRKSTFGVSSLYIILTQVANWTPFINALFLDHDDFVCCTYITFWECQELMIPMWQLAISTFSVICIHVLFVVYYTPTITDDEVVEKQLVVKVLGLDQAVEEEAAEDEEPEFAENDPHHVRNKEVVRKARMRQVVVFAAFNVLVVASIVLGFLFMWITEPYSTLVVTYSYILAFLGVLAVLFQFTPQIYMTFKIKERGALSLVMLLIQMPGTWIWLAYMILSGLNWSTWISTLVAATEVTILLFQVLWYEYGRKLIFGKKPGESPEEILAETTPLVQ